MRIKHKLIWFLLAVAILTILAFVGTIKVTAVYFRALRENPKQYYELKPIYNNNYMDEVERIRKENGVR